MSAVAHRTQRTTTRHSTAKAQRHGDKQAAATGHTARPAADDKAQHSPTTDTESRVDNGDTLHLAQLHLRTRMPNTNTLVSKHIY